jgi:hypothetical protein
MRRSMLAICALLAVTTAGCDKLKSMFGKKAPAPAVPQQVAPKIQAPPPQATPAPSPAPKTAVQRVADADYESPDTGTIAPGMTESQIYTLWGAPVAVRHMGTRTYLFFHNGCERSCGTADMVTLENGQVVDAITRWPGHAFSGKSSSPKGGRAPAPAASAAPADSVIASPAAPAPAPASVAAPVSVPVTADTTKKDTVPVTPVPAPVDTTKQKADSAAKDTTHQKPDSVAKDTTKAKPDSMPKDTTKQHADSTH